MAKECSVKGCNKNSDSLGLCVMHYTRKRRHNSLESTKNFHGLSKTSEHKKWRSIKDRCLNPKNKRYKDYGGRGISIYEPWIKDFLGFYNYITKEIGYKPNSKYSLDRINNDGNYEPGNLRWANYSTQNINQRPRYANNLKCEGVCWYKQTKKWRASISVNGKRIHLKYSVKASEAIKARLEGELKYWGYIKQTHLIHHL